MGRRSFRRLFPVLLSFSYCLVAIAQQDPNQGALAENKRLAYGNPFLQSNENFINAMNRFSGNEGVNLLLLDNWAALEVMGVNGELIVMDSANYHLADAKILFIYGGGMYELYPEKIQTARIGSHHFVSMQYEEKPRKLSRAYFEVLADGDYALLVRHDIEKQVTNDSPLGLPSTKEEKYVRTLDMYYLPEGATRPREVPLKKSEFIKIFRRDRNEMIEYAKANKLSQKDVEEVTQLFQYYNSIDTEQ